MKNLVYIISLPFFALYSCGSNADNNESSTSDETIVEEIVIADNEDDSEAESVMEVVEEKDFPIAEKFQIQDYATFLLDAKIYNTATEMRELNISGHYFEELNAKGGFARVTGAYDEFHEFVIWRMADGKDLVGKMTVGCGPACDYDFKFYIGKGRDLKLAKLSDIFPVEEMNKHKDEMVPKILDQFEFEYAEDRSFYYSFPKKGTDMRVDLVIGADELQTSILMLEWDKTRFSIKEKYYKVESVY